MNECIYCAKDERLQNVMIEICELQVSTVYLFREQTHKGRCVVALNDHYREVFQLPDAKREQYLQDVVKVAKALEQAFQPDKMNYGAYGDTMPHVHFHLVPKYKDEHSWGKPFEMNPGLKHCSDEEYQEIIEKIIKHLS